LRLAWSYSRNAHRRETLERVAERFRAVLVEVIAACHDERQPLAPADFPLAQLDEKRLQGVLARLERRHQPTNDLDLQLEQVK
jgi:hypothetical protein